MTTRTQKLTYEEWLKGPVTNQRYEIVDGEIVMPPAPTSEHQYIARAIFRALDQFVINNELGEVMFAPLDVVISREPLRSRQPDLLFVAQSRIEIMQQVIEGGPDLVIEVLSPSDTRGSISEKLSDYAAVDVRECWLVSPEARTVEVLELSDGAWQRLCLVGVDDSIQSGIFSSIELQVNNIFEG